MSELAREAARWLLTWLDRSLAEASGLADGGPGRAWLSEQVAKLTADPPERQVWTAISLVTRKLGHAALDPTDAELADAERCRPGWDPIDWTVDQAARVALLLSMQGGGEVLAQRLEKLCQTADVPELVAFYRGLPLYPEPPLYRKRAAEGVRTNVRAVFDAVAHRNPYPAEQLEEDAWNQLVLKALFIDSPLWPIVGLDERANPTLALMLSNYAHERWAAHRVVSPELWRCVGPFAEGELLDDLARVARDGESLERRAAVLALRASPAEAARDILESCRDGGSPEDDDWDRIGREHAATTTDSSKDS